MTVTRTKTIAVTFGLALSLAGSAEAVNITNPLSLTHPNVVGVLDGTSANQSADETAIAQQILALAQGATGTFSPDGGTIYANTAIDFDDTITDTGDKDETGGTSVPCCFEYVLGKYDGPGGGYILFYIGGEASTIPQFPYNFWTTKEQLGLSHFTPFNEDEGDVFPDGGSTAVLLGSALVAFGMLRRRLG
jgi:hypothetical protein